MSTFFFIPPLGKTSGGLAVLLAMARHLHQAGFPVCLVPREGLGPFDLAPDVPILPWDALELASDDIWLVPEGWPNALAPGLKVAARCVVYCQNWAYLFSSLPPGVTWDRLNVSFLAVSQPVAWFMEQTLGVKCSVLRPGIDLARFALPEEKPANVVNIAYMPRKNKALARQIREIFEARRLPPDVARLAPPIKWIEIAGQDQAGVARLLADAHIFLATGFPEGCPLPPLEAMASGCLPVGFRGFGGWDYMRQAWNSGLAGNFSPWFPLRPAEDTPWQGNGLWTADADTIAAALALAEAASWWIRRDPRLAPALVNARRTAQHYGVERQRDRVVELWGQGDLGGAPPSTHLPIDSNV